MKKKLGVAAALGGVVFPELGAIVAFIFGFSMLGAMGEWELVAFQCALQAMTLGVLLIMLSSLNRIRYRLFDYEAVGSSVYEKVIQSMKKSERGEK